MVDGVELAAVLSHCRALTDAALQLEALGRERDATIGDALLAWRGPHGRTFRARVDDEFIDRRAVVDGLWEAADAWAQAWADTVNFVNRERRQTRIDELSADRGFGERLVDVVMGDDSPDSVRPLVEVTAPTAATHFAPTGELERF